MVSGALQAAVNAGVFDSSDTAQYYAGQPKELIPAERAILNRLAPALRDAPLLDLGVGAGRTTPHLLQVSRDYVGVDYAANMIAACQRCFPGVAFQQGDARQLLSLGEARFMLVFFSFNGIDYVSHEERQDVLRQVFSTLRPGGWFVFSAHNHRTTTQAPWDPSQYVWTPRPGDIARNVLRLSRNTWNYSRLASGQTGAKGWGVRVDSMHRYRVLTYYVDPLEQVAQLTSQGFDSVECVDQSGGSRPAESDALNDVRHVHYVARRPPRT